MTGRERLLALLARQPLDRVPISTYELTVWGPHGWPKDEPSYQELMAYLVDHTEALPLWNPRVTESVDIPYSSVITEEDGYRVSRSTMHTPKGALTTTTKVDPTVKTVWVVEHPCKTEEDIDRYLSLPESTPTVDAGEFAVIDAEVGDRGLVLCDTGDAIGHVAPLFEFGEFTIFAMTEPERIRTLCDRAHRHIMQVLRGMLEAGCGPIFRIWGPEYVTPPYLPPSAFREFVVPYISEMVDMIHQFGCYARIHSHGRIREVLDMMVETGADGTDPVEPPPDGDITLGEVKQRYGDKLLLFGNMELKYLEQETPEEIDARVKAMMDEAKAGGGFVLMPTAAPINIPLSPRTARNYVAYVEAGLKYGGY